VKAITLICVITLALVANLANAKDEKHMMLIADAMNSPDYKTRLDPNVGLYFGDQKHADVIQSYGIYPTNKKTNAFNKGDREACEWVMLSALLTLQERAVKEGGNAVINIASYYKKNTMKSDTQFECHIGTFVGGVALIGEVVKLDK